MEAPFDILDDHPDAGPDASRRWVDEVRRSLTLDPGGWLRHVGAEGGDAVAMTKDEAWALLGWVETAASFVVADRRADLVAPMAFALSLSGAGPLDLRDVMVVGSLLRRACLHIDADFEALVCAGAGRADEVGRRALGWLLEVSPDLPSTHVEEGQGTGFRFRRRASSFDPAALERKLSADRRASRPDHDGAP